MGRDKPLLMELVQKFPGVWAEINSPGVASHQLLSSASPVRVKQ